MKLLWNVCEEWREKENLIDMARYRLLEVKDKLDNKGKPYWRVEKLILGLWWSKYFEEHFHDSATFYNKKEANTWYEYHTNPPSRIQIKVLAQNK